MIPVMTTNGSIISRQQLEILAAAGMKDLTISLDAPSADLHHQITQTHNTFERVVTAIQNSVEAGIHTIVKCVLTSSNYQKIPEFIDKKCGSGAPSHDELNKDKPDSPEGKKVVESGPHQGQTYFMLAWDAALRESRKQLGRLVGRELAPLPETGLDLTQTRYSREQMFRESFPTLTFI
jgi:MoaA/NifB/PqqE/SkfB family radical SAM enzyme